MSSGPIVAACAYELGPVRTEPNALGQQLHSYAGAVETVLEPALRTATAALSKAGVEPGRLDAIASLSLSPNGVAYDQDVCGPRLCHPLQRELRAENAWCFDAADGSVDAVIDLMFAYLVSTGKDLGLIVRSELVSSLEPCRKTGFSWSEGSGALLVSREPREHGWEMSERRTFHLVSSAKPCVIRWNEDIMRPDQAVGKIEFATAAAMQAELVTASSALAAQDHVRWESWFPRPGQPTQLGPLSFFHSLADQQSGCGFSHIHVNPLRAEWSWTAWRPAVEL